MFYFFLSEVTFVTLLSNFYAEKRSFAFENKFVDHRFSYLLLPVSCDNNLLLPASEDSEAVDHAMRTTERRTLVAVSKAKHQSYSMYQVRTTAVGIIYGLVCYISRLLCLLPVEASSSS